jgi:acetolactate synthase-like protein
MAHQTSEHGGQQVVNVLQKHGVRFVFTLCGGHISPILVAGEAAGLRVVDVRHEATAVFAADAVSRLSGVPGVAVVTAGPGLTNTITAVKNAQMAQSPVILLGGATATILKGRGSLQDIDQMALMRPHVKFCAAVKTVKQIVPTLEKAFAVAQSGVPGPVFVELPIDLLYPEATVREWYAADMPKGSSLSRRAIRWYMQRHLDRLFAGAEGVRAGSPLPVSRPQHTPTQVTQIVAQLQKARRPVLVLGSQVVQMTQDAAATQQAILSLGTPTYLSGMARGLLGHHPLHSRHKRKEALREADLVILAGVPCDFRLGYGNHISRKATFISINRSRHDLRQNRQPDIGILAEPGAFLRAVAAQAGKNQVTEWHDTLRQRDAARDADIQQQAEQVTAHLNPIKLCLALEQTIGENSVLIGDGGDFVATVSYTVRPRGPLSWLDPGPFGTLGAGAGFAIGAKLCRPDAEVWLLYGDGSCAYSLAEFDTFSRHHLPIIAVVGNDASWSQIARDQVEWFGTAVGTELAHTNYDAAAIGYGGLGYKLDNPAELFSCLQVAKDAAAQGRPVLLNAILGKTEFRKGSISI